MTFYEWASIVLVVTGEVGAVFAWIWNENRTARNKASADLGALGAVISAKVDLLENKNSSSLYQAKKDVFDKIREEKDILHERCTRIEQAHQQNRSEFTAELREIVATFTRTCDGLQSKLEQMTSTIIGQYVPRQEIDNRFGRLETKTDKVLDILIEMKS